MADAPALTVVLFGEAVRLKSDPLPVSITVCRLPAALSLTVKVQLREPEALGLNVTLMIQLDPVCNWAGQLLVCRKSPVT